MKFEEIYTLMVMGYKVKRKTWSFHKEGYITIINNKINRFVNKTINFSDVRYNTEKYISLIDNEILLKEEDKKADDWEVII